MGSARNGGTPAAVALVLVALVAAPRPAAASCATAYGDCVARTLFPLPGGGVGWNVVECDAAYIRCVGEAVRDY